MFEQAYKNLIRNVINNGSLRATRNATTISTFATTLVVNTLRHNVFPIITSRKMYIKGIAGEMATFLKGPKTLKDFEDNGCNYWDKWAEEDGSINVDYGNKWLDFNGVNQIQNVVDKIQNDPTDRRMLISGWDPSNLENLSLPCCHLLYQFYVTEDGYIDMIWFQRSADVMIGVPSDIVLAAILLRLVANTTGKKSGTITMHFGDTHIYEDHLPAASNYLKADMHVPPRYSLSSTIFDFETNDLQVVDYNHECPIKFNLYE